MFDSADKFQMLGRLLALCHKLPTEWHDEWKEKLCISQPVMRDCHPGHFLWIYATAKEEWVEQALPAVVERMGGSEGYIFMPQTEAGQRLVTTHGDLHNQNVLQMSECMIAIDFDCTCVAHAIHDLAYVLQGVDNGWYKADDFLVGHGVGDLPVEQVLDCKRVFLAAYLSEMGDSSTAADVDAVLLDAQLCFHMPIWPVSALPRMDSLKPEEKEALKYTTHDDKACAFKFTNKKFICSQTGMGLGTRNEPPLIFGSWIIHCAILVPVSEALEVIEVDGHLEAMINDRSLWLSVDNCTPRDGAGIKFIIGPDDEADTLRTGSSCLNENGTISACQANHLKISADPGPDDAEVGQLFSSKCDSFEAYATQARGDAALQESLFLKGQTVAYADWLGDAQMQAE